MEMPTLGLWWFPQAADRQVSGTLHQSEDGTFTLRTHSGLETAGPVAGEQDILGLVGGVPWTIQSAAWRGSESQGPDDPDWTREQYVSRRVISGLHVGPRDVFDSVDIESEFLDAWIDRHIWESRLSEGLRMSHANLEMADYANGTLSLAFSISSTLGHKHWSVTRHTHLHVRPHNGQLTVSQSADQVQHFDSLLDLIFGQPTSAKKVAIRKGRLMSRFGLRGTIGEPRYAEPTRRLHGFIDGLCTFEDFGGLAGLAKWFSLDETYRHLAGRITSHYRNEGRYREDRALTAFAAGEALDRAETQTRQSTARTRWKRMASKIPSFIDSFIGLSLDDWSDALVTARDDLAHLLTVNSAPKSAARMDAMARSAHLLSILTLLRIAGLEDAVDKMATGQRWRDEREAYEHTMRAADLM